MEDEETDSPLVRFLTLLALLVVLPVVGLVGGLLTRLPWLAILGGGALALGLALVGTIWLAGRLARAHRAVLVAVFAPLLVLTNLALVPLIALNGVVATLAVGAVFPIAGVLMGIGAVFGVVAMLGRALTFPVARSPRVPVDGVAVTPESQPRLWAFVRETAARVGTAPPQHVVAGLDPEFFVTQAPVVCRDGELRGRTLFVSLPFARILSVEELRAVVAHELGHFKGRDTRYSQLFYPVYRGALDSLARLGQEVGEGVGGLPLLPAFYLLRYFLDAFAEAAADLARTRELAADRVAVGATDGPTAATALVKVHGFHRYWRRALAVLRERIARAEADLNASADFAAAAEEHRESVWLRRDLDEEPPPHPTDSHPPLSVRLQPLGLSIRDVSDAAFTVRPAPAAIGLFDAPEDLERALTAVEKARLIESRQVFEGSKAS